MEHGIYRLNLTCDSPYHTKGHDNAGGIDVVVLQYSRKEAVERAKKWGWVFEPNGFVTCPKCADPLSSLRSTDNNDQS